MRSPMGRVLLSTLLLLLGSCGPAQQPQQAPPQAPMPQAQAPRGPTASNAVLAARQQAQQQPGPLSAYHLARTVHGHAEAGYYAQQNSLLLTDASDAISRLKAATAVSPEDQALLTSWMGILHLDMGRTEVAMQELHEALSYAPSNLAAGALVNLYAARSEMSKLFEVCTAVAPALADPNEIYQLTQHCMQNSRAISQEGALSWAPPSLATWFHQETRRRQGLQQQQQMDQQRADEAAEREASARQAEDSRRQSEAARQRSSDAVASYACSQECRETGYDCQSECDGNGACEFGCSSTRDRCLRDCKN